MPPRYTNPGGFGGAYDEPTKGEFQPGSETAPSDPNAGKSAARLFAVVVEPSARLYGVTVKPNAKLYSATVAPGA